jgi:hypothetical protein
MERYNLINQEREVIFSIVHIAGIDSVELVGPSDLPHPLSIKPSRPIIRQLHIYHFDRLCPLWPRALHTSLAPSPHVMQIMFPFRYPHGSLFNLIQCFTCHTLRCHYLGPEPCFPDTIERPFDALMPQIEGPAKSLRVLLTLFDAVNARVDEETPGKAFEQQP